MAGHAASSGATVAVIVVAAGKGIRAGGDVPKQYRQIGGASVLDRTIRKFSNHPDVNAVLPVIGADDRELYEECVGEHPRVLCPVIGGASRQESVLAGLDALAEQAAPPDFVLVHDGARPFVEHALIERVIDALESGATAVVPALPVTDTIKQVEFSDDRTITATVDRATLRRVQTPQGFHFDSLLKLHRELSGSELTDDAALFEHAGGTVITVSGDASNLKLTTPDDFNTAEERMTHRQTTRTGIGFDVHRLEAGESIILCGIEIPHVQKLAGHSDADVGLHAITDAVLGGLGAGDIGDHFPPSDPQWKGASSDRFLAHAARLVRDRDGTIDHIDVTLICERPKIGPFKGKMRERIASIVDIDVDAVSVKATTTERLGFTGRGEGIAAQAIATIRV